MKLQRILAGVLLLSCFLVSNTVQAETSQNLIDPQAWSGATYGNDPGGCCASVSGSGPLYDNSTGVIMYSYGQYMLSQSIAINNALKLSGVEVNGYNYNWTYRLVPKSSPTDAAHTDTLIFYVEVVNSKGQLVEQYQYDRSAPVKVGQNDQWVTESGTETFNNPYVDPQSIIMRIIGKDGGFWGGYYGPEIKDIGLSLNYQANPCGSNPMFDPSCPGYADAYAQMMYDQNCAADPLYDSGCPGYASAYETQQCNANPLYSQSCPGYQQAYYDQQCSMNPLYDTGCPGYQQAYYDQQCAANPLYDSGCSGYAKAHHDQQCSANPLYATDCPGYQQAYYSQQCKSNPLYDTGCPGYAPAFYSQQCSITALYDTGCPGYAAAYYDQQCSLNPLYDSGCTGYDTAYFNQQCSLNSLYDANCPDYATAYYNQQCTADPLYDSGCPGYSTAYFNQQCSLNPLYDATCPGYATAYYNQQCTITALYDTGCPGYQEAYATKMLLEQQQEETSNPVVESETASIVYVDPVASLTTVSTTGDSVVDSVLAAPVATVVSAPVQEVVVQQVEVASNDTKDEEPAVSDTSSDVDESVDTGGDGDDTGSEGESDSGGETSSSGDSKPKSSSKPKSTREKVKEAMSEKAQNLANEMSDAASLQAQQAVQSQLTAIMNYNPGFAAYGQFRIPGVDFYASEEIYVNAKVPESRSGLRNGLAQQILHTQMVDSQYEGK
jgi:hypothetical protein